MSTQVRHPIWLPAVTGQAGAKTFATLYGIESFTRASIASVVPIQAYDLLRSEQSVSLLYTMVAIVGLSVTLFMPMLIARFARRWVYTAGTMILAVGSLCFMLDNMPGQIVGMLCRVMGASMLSITLNLYIMDHIRKTEITHVESTRLAWSTIAWTAGPTLGVFVYTNYGLMGPYLVALVFAFILLAVFWYFRLTDNSVIRPGPNKPSNPLRNVHRFISQPRLRLAWVIAFGRNCFWATFFVYAPLLMVVTGQGSVAGGLLVSGGNALLFMALPWGKAGKRYGARRVMGAAFLCVSVALVIAGLIGETQPWLTAFFLLCAAFFVIAMDALGSAAFMRAVHSYERPQMTAVYRTYLDMSELLPPLIYSVVLAFTGIGGVFVTLGCFTLVCGILTWIYLPKSL